MKLIISNGVIQRSATEAVVHSDHVEFDGQKVYGIPNAEVVDYTGELPVDFKVGDYQYVNGEVVLTDKGLGEKIKNLISARADRKAAQDFFAEAGDQASVDRIQLKIDALTAEYQTIEAQYGKEYIFSLMGI